jgi:L-asparagine transporter-like permease
VSAAKVIAIIALLLLGFHLLLYGYMKRRIEAAKRTNDGDIEPKDPTGPAG